MSRGLGDVYKRQERNRIHEEYDPSVELDGQPREMREITPGHFVLCTEAEAEAYKKEL